jgi:DNA-3-methyladenine glycosylase I
MSSDRVRCWGNKDPLGREYHDTEWGTPSHDDGLLFEHIVLEGFQAGLSWGTILKKREAFRKAFEGFDPKRVARYNEKDIERIMCTEGIIRNRRKVESAINNAKRFLEVQKEFGSFDRYAWGFVGGKTIQHDLKEFSEMQTESKESKAMSADMKGRGFTFIGPTSCYAYMQAVGMINDHIVRCFRHGELKAPK